MRKAGNQTLQLFLDKGLFPSGSESIGNHSRGDVLALDAKVNFDSNALFRHPDVVELRDLTEEDAKEAEASKFDLNYIALDGNVACMVNPWTGHGYDGHYQALWWVPREFPGCGWRSQ